MRRKDRAGVMSASPETSGRGGRMGKLSRLEQEMDICSCLSQAQASLSCSLCLPS